MINVESFDSFKNIVVNCNNLCQQTHEVCIPRTGFGLEFLKHGEGLGSNGIVVLQQNVIKVLQRYVQPASSAEHFMIRVEY